MRRRLAIGLLAGLVALTACTGGDDGDGTTPPTSPATRPTATTVTSTATSMPEADVDAVTALTELGALTFLELADIAGLSERLEGPGPLTVLAPSEEAFARLDPGVLDGLRADPAALRAVLDRHVLTGAASTLPEGATGVAVTNGRVAVIDRVLGLDDLPR